MLGRLVKITARIVLVLFSIFLAYRTGLYAERFTVAPLRSGGFEGTPLTLPAFLFVFSFVLLAVLSAGNVLVNHYFRAKRLP
jgi:hypothetical protein